MQSFGAKVKIICVKHIVFNKRVTLQVSKQIILPSMHILITMNQKSFKTYLTYPKEFIIFMVHKQRVIKIREKKLFNKHILKCKKNWRREFQFWQHITIFRIMRYFTGASSSRAWMAWRTSSRPLGTLSLSTFNERST